MRARPLVLNVDDDDGGRYAVGRALKQNGYDVVDATTGEDGLRLTGELRPDVVLLDVRLPGIDGFEVCRRIRQDSEIGATPVIQMSASYLDAGSRVKGLENGADAYLTEPVENAILIATIRSLLRIKRAELGVTRSARQWQTTFDAIRDGVALLDAEGKTIQNNAAYEQIAAPVASALLEPIGRALALLRAGAGRQTVEVPVEARTLLLTLDPVLTDANFDGAVCVVADITEKARFEAELRQTARLESIGVLAGGIAHDFNNLLTGIIGNSNLLLEMLSPASVERELAQETLKASESAADLTRQILAYGGQGRFLKAPVNISLIAQESRPFVRRFMPTRVELIYDIDPNLPAIHGDASQMLQLVMNLVINAAESFGASDRGVVRVETGREELDAAFFRTGENIAPGTYVTLMVTDTGSGMDDSTLGRIFDPFFTTKFTGRGLGLSAVHGILRSHEGFLRVDTAIGQGTKFKLYFPASKTQTIHPPVTKASPSRKAHGTILFVDDESTVRNFAKVALKNRGYGVLLAENGEIAVDVFKKSQDTINLVILDFTMPVMNGEEAFSHLREISPNVPIILSSGFSQSVAAEKFKGKALDGFLGKPYTPAQIVATVEKERWKLALEEGWSPEPQATPASPSPEQGISPVLLALHRFPVRFQRVAR